ncbi:MAG: GNAT family protein [Eubacteriales bacterium]|nr:GNAT family protein [Eubacteriales bacterium]
MKIHHKNIILRDMVEGDIEDDIRWQTSETEWQLWDEPWELPNTAADSAPAAATAPASRPDTEDLRRRALAEFALIEQLRKEDDFRWTLEIDYEDGTHIGSVDSYYIDQEFNKVRQKDAQAKAPLFYALGIAIYEPAFWGRGLGTQALEAYIQHHFEHHHDPLFLQTWSGNHRMLRCAEKMGFYLVERRAGVREVRGELYDALTFRLDLKSKS